MTEQESRNLDRKDKLPSTRFHKVIEITTLVILMTMVIYPIIVWGTLPAKLPMHYNALGEIDRWGSKLELIIMPVIGVLMYGLMTLVSAYPSTWNIPVTVTRENRIRVYQCTKSMLVLMKLEIIVIFAYLEYMILHLQALASSFLGVVIVVVFGTIIFSIVRMYKVARRRVEKIE
ncbi:MAG: hypothetical protein K0R46_66 [Herbinix sp.]|nr:hypothetical protein [Herbinix sp.]